MPWDQLIREVATHPAGLASYRMMSIIPPNQNEARIRVDVEGIDGARRLEFITSLLTREPTQNILWDNVFLFWSTFLPDNEGVQIMRIRDLAVELQNMDVNETWGYAALRQKVHNFPNPQIVNELETELIKVKAQNPTDQRIPLLEELHRLEKDFWYGTALSADFVRGWIDVFNLEKQIGGFNLSENDSSDVRIDKLLSVRERSRRLIGMNGRDIENLMHSSTPLQEPEAELLISYLTFDRKLGVEIIRQFSKMDNTGFPEKRLQLLARALYLDGFLGLHDRNVAVRLSEQYRKNFEQIQRILEFPIQDVQGRFAAFKMHYSQIRASIPPFFREDRQNRRREILPRVPEVMGEPDRLLALADMEIRQSLLFNAGVIVGEIAKAVRPAIKVRVENKMVAPGGVEIIRPMAAPIGGRLVVVHDKESLKLAQDYAAEGRPVILLKTMDYDIELPPVKMLLTVDQALNRASHMALLAESSRIPHLNFANKTSDILAALKKWHGKDVNFSFFDGVLDISQGKGDDKSPVAGPAQRLRLVNRIEDRFSRPVRLENLLAIEGQLPAPKNQISGGKGRGLALLLSLASPEQRKILATPPAVQIPYGFFMKWFEETQFLKTWTEALSRDTTNGSVRWITLNQTLASMNLPPAFLDEVIETLQPETLSDGWFVRSNSNGEDGKFNAAGVNLTLPDTRTRKTLGDAIVRVFFAPYHAHARSWWNRMFINPEEVRSTVLLMKTIRSTHSSVALLSADGKMFTIDSLPGTGENVVGGSGAVSERLAIELEKGEMKSSRVLQSAFGQNLLMWNEHGEIEHRPLIIKGAVLSQGQQEAAARLIALVRILADQTGELRGKPLDTEIAWTGDIPHLVQVREAPADPRPDSGSFVLNGAKSVPANGELAQMNSLALANRIISEMNSARTVSPTLQVKISLLRTLGLPSSEIADEIYRVFVASRLAIFEAMAKGDLHIQTGINQLRALNVSRLALGNTDRRFNAPLIRFPSPEADRILADLDKLLRLPENNRRPALLSWAAECFSEDHAGRFFKALFARMGPDNVRRILLPSYDNDAMFAQRFKTGLGAYVTDQLQSIYRDPEDSARHSFANLQTLWPAIHGSSIPNMTDTIYEKLRALIRGRFPTPQLENEFRHEFDEYGRALGGVHFEVDGYNVTRKREVELDLIITKFEKLRSLARMRAEFIEDALEREEHKAPIERSVDRLSGILLEVYHREYAQRKTYEIRAVRLLNTIPDLKVVVIVNPNQNVEVKFCAPNQNCQFYPYTKFPITALFHFPRLEFDMTTKSLLENPDHILPLLLSENDFWPTSEELVRDPDKLYLLLTHVYAVAADNDITADDLAPSVRRLNSVLDLALKTKFEVSQEQWLRWVQFYLECAYKAARQHERDRRPSHILDTEVFEKLAKLIQFHAPFDLSRWQVTQASDSKYTSREMMNLSIYLRPPGAAPKSEALMTIHLMKSNDGSHRDIRVWFFDRFWELGAKYSARSLRISPPQTAVQAYLQALNWISGGNLAKFFGADGEPGQNRLRRMKACEAELETPPSSEAPPSFNRGA